MNFIKFRRGDPCLQAGEEAPPPFEFLFFSREANFLISFGEVYIGSSESENKKSPRFTRARME
ncbi:conserved domain protein [Parasutterella excrementihominis YIT 11859]|uniref:Conserved domain protein n=1 Tax=Parasutterella excrementihominis YIT 11859 TaxID=762966 RepID=F3QJS8_9BURK|nr:conserved domain protein [Parasutterella excrementihominis YIT 11859]